MAIVRPSGLSVEQHHAAGRRLVVGPAPACPRCGGPMIFWSGYWRLLRRGFDPEATTGRLLRIWVARVHCKACGHSPGLLPEFCLSRRLDEVEVIGLAVVWVAGGRAVAAVAALLAVARSTVRGWIARFAVNAQSIVYRFAGLAVEWGAGDFDLPAAAARAAVEAIGRAYEAASRRLAGNVSALWRFVSAVSGGAALATNRSPP